MLQQCVIMKLFQQETLPMCMQQHQFELLLHCFFNELKKHYGNLKVKKVLLLMAGINSL